MRTFTKPGEAATVLVRLGGILQLCCEPPGIVQSSRITERPSNNHPPYDVYNDRDRYINAPGPQGYIRPTYEIQSGYFAYTKEPYTQNVQQNRRSFPGFKVHREDDKEHSLRNILRFRDPRVKLLSIPSYHSTLNEDSYWKLQSRDTSTFTTSVDYLTSTVSHNSNPWVISDRPTKSWDKTHWVPGERFTILPTISVVQPWDHLPHLHRSNTNFGSDMKASESIDSPIKIEPTPVFWTTSKNIKPKINNIIEMPKNLTGRFFDMLRKVLTNAEIAKKNLTHIYDDVENTKDGTKKLNPILYQEFRSDDSNLNLLRHDDGTLEASKFQPKVSERELEKGVVYTPLLMICTVMAILVIALILMYHHQHIRRECFSEHSTLERLKYTFRQTKGSEQQYSSGSEISIPCSVVVEPIKVKDVTL